MDSSNTDIASHDHTFACGGHQQNGDSSISTAHESASRRSAATSTSASNGSTRVREDVSRLFRMPPVVGSMLQYPNKTLKYRPFPPNLNAVRQKLYRIDQPLLLDSQAIADYFPHMSNIWLRSSAVTVHEGGCVTEAWECRVRRRVVDKGEASASKGLRQRNSKDRLIDDVAECRMRIRLVSYTKHAENSTDPECLKPGFDRCKCIAEWLHISRSRQAEGDVTHTHEIGLLDTWNRSYAILYFAKWQIENNSYGYTAFMRWAKAKYGDVCDELQYLTNQDVANAARPWRAKNKDVKLKESIEEFEESTEQIKIRECMDGILQTEVEGLRKALQEVVSKIPEAVGVILPFLEKRPDDAEEEDVGIQEGEDLVFPEPWPPPKRYDIVHGPENRPQSSTTNPAGSNLSTSTSVTNAQIPQSCQSQTADHGPVAGPPQRDSPHTHPPHQQPHEQPNQMQLPDQRHQSADDHARYRAAQAQCPSQQPIPPHHGHYHHLPQQPVYHPYSSPSNLYPPKYAPARPAYVLTRLQQPHQQQPVYVAQYCDPTRPHYRPDAQSRGPSYPRPQQPSHHHWRPPPPPFRNGFHEHHPHPHPMTHSAPASAGPLPWSVLPSSPVVVEPPPRDVKRPRLASWTEGLDVAAGAREPANGENGTEGARTATVDAGLHGSAEGSLQANETTRDAGHESQVESLLDGELRQVERDSDRPIEVKKEVEEQLESADSEVEMRLRDELR